MHHVPERRFVWRGLKNVDLPQEFLVENPMHFRGGVERSMMSTTRQKSIAVQVNHCLNANKDDYVDVVGAI
jgi:hypothetical protein